MLLFITSLGHILVVEACFDPSDKYSVEVVLSKPGVVFNKSVLEELRGIVSLSDRRGDHGIYVYRSHVNPENLVVILSFQPLSLREGSDKYPTIRIEGNTILVKVSVRTYKIAVKNYNETVSVEEFKKAAKKQGWDVKGVSICPCGSDISLLLSKNYEGYSLEARATLSNNSRSTSLLLTIRLKDKINDTMVLLELENIIRETLGYNTSIDISKTTSTEQLVEPASPSINEESLKKALKTELEWLSSIGAIKGLSNHDIDEIIGSIREGMAGWNERLVYYNGVWEAYSELVDTIPGATLVKSGYGCSWSYPLELLPDKPPLPRLSDNPPGIPSTDQTIMPDTDTTSIPEPPTTTTTINHQIGTNTTSSSKATSTVQALANRIPYLVIGLISLSLIALLVISVYRRNHKL